MDEVRRLIGLAWPVVLGQVGMMAMTVVDLLMVRSLGDSATVSADVATSRFACAKSTARRSLKMPRAA